MQRADHADASFALSICGRPPVCCNQKVNDTPAAAISGKSQAEKYRTRKTR